MDQNLRSKKYLYSILGISIFLGLVGIGFLFMGELFHKTDTINSTLLGIIVSGGFFGCFIIALVLIICNFKHFAAYNFAVQTAKCDCAKFTIIENISSENVQAKFYHNNFRATGSGYLRKKVFSFSKDAICYYARTSNLQHIEPEIQEELNLFDSEKDKSKNICFLLFVYKTELCDDDFNVLRDYSKAFILGETIVPTQYCHTAVLVLVDSENMRGYFLDMQKKYSFSIYAYGCKLIKKYFQTINA